MKTNYNKYFEKHLGYRYKQEDLDEYRQWFYAQYKIILSKLKIKKKDKVLEIGAGIGGFYSYIEGSNYIGLEMDKKAVEFANKFFRISKFKHNSLEEFERKGFDKIFAFEVLEHLENPLESISKIRSMLKEDGVFCGTSPYPFSKNVLADETHIYVLNPENWKKLFLTSGFKKVELYPMSFLPLVWRINKRFNIRIPIYIPFYGFISTCLIIAKK